MVAGLIGAGLAAAIGGAWYLLSSGDDPPPPPSTSTSTSPSTSPGAADGFSVLPTPSIALAGGGDPAACGAVSPPTPVTRPTYSAPPTAGVTGGRYVASVKTSCGTFELELFADQAPKTVDNFVALSRDGFFIGVVFHRVIQGFMNQSGDPLGTGYGGPGYEFADEFDPALTFEGPGVLAMANSGADSNGSQFFVTVGPATHLNGLHAIFGHVVSGMDVVERINALPVDGEDRPLEPVYIESIIVRVEAP
jgi:cyclophilin family peptidyl-prolyl cis-trans isomerase